MGIGRTSNFLYQGLIDAADKGPRSFHEYCFNKTLRTARNASLGLLELPLVFATAAYGSDQVLGTDYSRDLICAMDDLQDYLGIDYLNKHPYLEIIYHCD